MRRDSGRNLIILAVDYSPDNQSCALLNDKAVAIQAISWNIIRIDNTSFRRYFADNSICLIPNYTGGVNAGDRNSGRSFIYR
tara:strand:- start:498 stop:743 length:246 start_codon:yes stop_codon:yes gene_type:complete